MREEEEARTSCRCHPQRPHPPWPPSTVPPGGGQREPGHPGVAAAGPQPHALPSAHVPTLLVTPHPREAELWSPEQWDCPPSQEAEGAGVACPVRAPQGLWDAASASHPAAHPAPPPTPAPRSGRSCRGPSSVCSTGTWGTQWCLAGSRQLTPSLAQVQVLRTRWSLGTITRDLAIARAPGSFTTARSPAARV